MKRLIKLVLVFYFGLNLGGLQAQSNMDHFKFEINQVFEPLSISRETLEKARSLKDLNPYFENDWVDSYLQVDIYAWKGHKHICKTNQSHLMSQDQKDLIIAADVDSHIAVEVHYLPKNDLKENTPKMNTFSFKVNPDQVAKYSKGDEALLDFMQNDIVNKIDPSKFDQYQLAAVKFTVDAEGAIKNISILESSKDDNLDAMLINGIAKMDDWIPATYFEGTKVEQDFVFTLGDHRSCIIPTLHTRKFSLENH